MTDDKLLRVKIEVDQDWKVTISCGDPCQPPDQVLVPGRAMQKFPDGAGGFFPGPPAEELPSQNAPQSTLSSGNIAEIRKAYDSLVNRRADQAQVFGAYLFDCLIGEKVWNEKILPTSNGADLIEIALVWDPGDKGLHRLNWELMSVGGSFLVVHPKRRVTYTRLVKNTPNLKAVPAVSPPKVLFVVGTTLTDPQIRPGTEYLGLVRRSEGKGGSLMNTRLIYEATLYDLQKSVERFQPDVVYFICHGYKDAKGEGYVILQGEKKGEQKAVYADQLVQALQQGGKLPQLVVLSACYTGSGGVVLGGPEASPLAAKLVSSGIPVVIAMAGRVSDDACRLFTRRTSEALVLGQKLVVATAQGRRAAHIEGLSLTKSVDWSFPTVYMGECVDPAYCPVDPKTVADAQVIENRLNLFPLTAQPVFCGREDFLRAYDNLYAPDGHRVLACPVKVDIPGYGKTRLLQELTASALRDGRAPCLVSPPKGIDPPTTPGKLGFEILRAIALTRQALGLPPPLQSLLLQLLLIESPPPNLAQIEGIKNAAPIVYFTRLMEYFEKSVGQSLEAGSAVEAVRADLVQLASDANTQVLVLLDEVHLYDKALQPLLAGWLNGNGLGQPGKPVPVVLTFSENTPADQFLRPFKEAGHSWVKLIEIQAFSDQGEDMLVGEDILAYERVFLNPYTNLLPPLAINAQAKPEVIEKFVKLLRSEIKGLPINLTSDAMRLLALWGQSDGFLVPADDGDILKRMEQQGLL